MAGPAVMTGGKHTPGPVRLTDAGRSQSRRPRQKNDCTVRAFALATGRPYDEAYDLIAAAGRKCSGRFHFRAFAEQQGFQWIGCPAVKGQKRTDPYKFAAANPRDRFIIKTAKHVAAVIDGVILDDEAPRPGRCVYGAWRVA